MNVNTISIESIFFITSSFQRAVAIREIFICKGAGNLDSMAGKVLCRAEAEYVFFAPFCSQAGRVVQLRGWFVARSTPSAEG